MKTKQYVPSNANSSLSENTEKLLQFCVENQESETAQNIDLWFEDNDNFFELDNEVKKFDTIGIFKNFVAKCDRKKFAKFWKKY